MELESRVIGIILCYKATAVKEASKTDLEILDRKIKTIKNEKRS
jgi:hypothetical protein